MTTRPQEDEALAVAPDASPVLVPPAQTPEGKAALAAIWQKKWADARASQRLLRTIGILAFVALPVCLCFFGPKLWTYLIPLFWIFIFDVARPSSLSESEYYSVPGARDEAGKHQCIYCCGHEIEVHHYGRTGGMLRTLCASCKKFLF